MTYGLYVLQRMKTGTTRWFQIDSVNTTSRRKAVRHFQQVFNYVETGCRTYKVRVQVSSFGE